MVPPQVHEGCSSIGERELFARLRDDPATNDWIVLHSLDVSHHKRQISGEIDFLILIPRLGILCVEVKACRELRRERGSWYYGPDADPDTRGPFKQASEAMHSIRERVSRRMPGLHKCIFWSAVIFPYLDFNVQSEEWHSWQVIDARALRARPISVLVRAVLEEARKLLFATPSARWFDPQAGGPNRPECEALMALVRPSFELFESPRARLRGLDEDVKRYTLEQYAALDAMHTNQRVVFEGPAGTGKTLLAIEAARRGAAAGRRVLLLCFNRLLGHWLESQTQPLRPQVGTSTLHSHMLAVGGQGPVPPNAGAAFWECELPEHAVAELLNDNKEWLYDELVVDEAQDLLREAYLDVLDLSLRGGLATGRWRFFGDFEGQSIYDSSEASAMLARLRVRAGNVPQFSLRTNCRNTPRIAELVHVLGGLTPPYARILRPDDGVEPELRYYSDARPQSALLGTVLDALARDGFRGGDVTVLSTRALNPCAGTVTLPEWRNRLKPITNDDASQTSSISYCSIHAFKGLEAPAIVVTDVEQVGDAHAMSLFYIATTRALHRLVILAHERVRSEARALVRRQLAGQA